MINYILKKFLRLILVLVGVSIMTFSLTCLVPGNPAEIILSQSGAEPTKEEIYKLEEKMGLNKPIHIQYFNWMGNVIKGDLGTSYVSREPVVEEIAYRLPNTIKITVISFIIMTIIAFPIGILSALYKNELFDGIVKVITFTFMAIPSFWLGFILISSFSMKLKIFPVAGSESLKHLVLPTIVLALPMACKYIRLIRISFIEALEEEYVYSLKAKGIRERIIVVNNVIKNAMIPIIPSLAMSIGGLLGGSVVVENIFAWPGLGNYLVSAIMNRDFPVIQAYVLLMGIIFVMINFLADFIAKILDPKISNREAKF